MSSPPPIEFHPGMEIVPGYTLITPLGSGMAGDVWQAQAAGGIKVALKVVRNLQDLGGRKELKALKTIRDVHHPNLCPLFGFWTKDAEGRVLADGETEELTFDSTSSAIVNQPPPPPADSGPVSGDSGNVAVGMDGTMAIGAGMPIPSPDLPDPAAQAAQARKTSGSGKSKIKAEQLIVVMGLGDCTLYDRLKYVRHEAGLGPDAIDTPFGLDPAESVRYLRAAASAIDLLNQEHQIYHCDIKPQNILLVGGEAQVCDFGLAKQMEGDMRQTQQAFATPAYAPPEVLHGEGYSRQVDQYSLAVTYYELRTGLLPFDITTHASMLVAKSTGKLNLDALTPSERKVLQKALRRVPSERYKSCSEFIDAIAVASGVEKSGGITIGRLVAAVAIMSAVFFLAMFGWRQLAPESFEKSWVAVFGGGKAEMAATLLQGATQDYQAVIKSQKDIVAAEGQLMRVLRSSAKVAGDVDGDQKQEAEALFANAALTLLQLTHESMQEVEDSENQATSDPAMKLITDCLDNLLIEDPKPKTDIAKGFAIWKSSPEQQASFQKFNSLYDAAVVRYHLLAGLDAPVGNVEGLRSAISDRPDDFEIDSPIGLRLASLLPVVATVDVDQLASTTTLRWVSAPLLDDMIAAEKADSQNLTPTTYSSQWSRIRESFTVAVAPVIEGTADRVVEIDLPTRQKILDGFPDIQIAKQVADLRSNIADGRWEEAASLILELQVRREQDELDEGQRILLIFADAVSRHRGDANGLTKTLEKLAEEDIDISKLSEIRAQPIFTSLMSAIAEKLLQENASSRANTYQAMKYALRLKESLGVSIPVNFARLSTISLLTEKTEDISDESAREQLQISKWNQLLQSNDQSKALSAAMQLEYLIGLKRADQKAINAALDTLKSSELSDLEQISSVYPKYLFVCADCLKDQSINESASALKTSSREAVQSLGSTRLLLGIELLVVHAIRASGVTEEDDFRLRYAFSDKQASRSDAMRAREYLSLAEFLADETDQKVTTELMNELFISSVAEAERSADPQSIPPLVLEKLASMETARHLPSPVLRAVHKLGSDLVGQRGRLNVDFNLKLQLLVRPSAVLIERYGIEKFGTKLKAKGSKDQLIGIAKTTVDEVLYPLFDLGTSGLQPKPFDADPRVTDAENKELIEFCNFAAAVYADLELKSKFMGEVDYQRNTIALALTALDASDLSNERVRNLHWQIATLAFSTPDDIIRGVQLTRLTDHLASKQASEDVLGYLGSEAYYRSASQELLRIDREELLEKAFNASANACEVLANDSPSFEEKPLRLYEIHARNADYGVELAFLKSREEKAEILKLSKKNIDFAVGSFQEGWYNKLLWPHIGALLTKGNVREDLAFYCSQGPDPEVTKQREDYFRESVQAFKAARERNRNDLKTRYALGRCLYRWAISYEGDERQKKLQEASEAIGSFDAEFDIRQQSSVEVLKAAKWMIWKIQIEDALDNEVGAQELALAALPFIQEPRIEVETRSDLAVIASSVLDAPDAAECLLALGADGGKRRLLLRMGKLSYIAFGRELRGERIFSKVLSILATLEFDPEKPLNLSDEDDEAYEIAKVGMLAMREQIVNEKLRKSNATADDHSIGIRVFFESMGPGQYRRLAAAFFAGDDAFRSDDPESFFEFLCELAEVSVDVPEPPVMIADRTYIKNNCYLILLYGISHWGQQIDMSTAEGKKAYQSAKEHLTEQRFDDLVSSLQNLRALYQKFNNRNGVANVDLAISTLKELRTPNG